MNLRKLIPVFYTTLLLAACGGKDKKTDGNSPASKLEGVWEIKQAGEDVIGAANLGTVYEFRGNKLTLSKDNIVTPGTSIITDSTFSFTPDNYQKTYVGSPGTELEFAL